MTNYTVWGNYAFTTVYEEFTNQQSGPRNFRVVKIVTDRYGNEASREVEIISVAAGQTVSVYQNLNNFERVTFKLFRRDYSVDGTYEEFKIWEKTTSPEPAPLGPR